MKLMGMGMIGIGIIGCLNAWIQSYKERIKCMEAIVHLLRQAIHVMETNPRPWQEFFGQYKGQDKNLNEFTKRLGELLLTFTYPTGEEAWKNAMLEVRIQGVLPQEGYELFESVSKGFFGPKKEENKEILSYIKTQMEDCIRQEKQKFLQQRKIVLPIGTLGGIMLVILLL